jgi:hypothetical protein
VPGGTPSVSSITTMRNRSRIVDYVATTVQPFQENWVGHGTYTVSAGTGLILVDERETMIDDISKGRHSKEVKHQRKRLTRSTMSDGTLTQGSNVFVQTGAQCFWHVWGLGAADFVNHDHIPTKYPKSDDQLIRQTLDDFYNTNEVDSLLNVVESPELVTGLTGLARKVDLPRIATSAIRRLRSGRWDVNPRKVSTSLFTQVKKAGGFLSGGYLYYAFGIAPLVADMRKVARNLQKYRKQLAAVVEKAGQTTSVYNHVDGVFMPFGYGAPLPDGYGAVSNAGKYWTASIQSMGTPRKTCVVTGIRDHKYSSTGFQTMDYLMSRFAGVGPASFLWERIPFSFVVDWFVDLSDVFNRLDNALTGNRKKVKSVTVSEKWKCLCPVVKIPRVIGESDTRDGQQMALCELSHYYRQSVDPNLSIGVSQRFGKKQAGILAALVTNIGANLRAKR